jgi:hypothetical protein
MYSLIPVCDETISRKDLGPTSEIQGFLDYGGYAAFARNDASMGMLGAVHP